LISKERATPTHRRVPNASSRPDEGAPFLESQNGAIQAGFWALEESPSRCLTPIGEHDTRLRQRSILTTVDGQCQTGSPYR
jgi:hypothetical protein